VSSVHVHGHVWGHGCVSGCAWTVCAGRGNSHGEGRYCAGVLESHGGGWCSGALETQSHVQGALAGGSPSDMEKEKKKIQCTVIACACALPSA